MVECRGREFIRAVLVPKLQLGNSVREAPASRLAKLRLHGQEMIQSFLCIPHIPVGHAGGRVPKVGALGDAGAVAESFVIWVPKLELGNPRKPRSHALRRESRPASCVYGTQRVQHYIPTQRVGTRGKILNLMAVTQRVGMRITPSPPTPDAFSCRATAECLPLLIAALRPTQSTPRPSTRRWDC